MDVVLQAALIGLLQGLTEFIPVSSSAHLELVPWILGWETDALIGTLAFDVFLHLGTLVALLVYFAGDWLRYLGAWLGEHPRAPHRRRPRSAAGMAAPRRHDPRRAHRLRRSRDFIEDTFHGDDDAARLAIAGFLVIGRAALWLADRLGSRDARARRRERPDGTGHRVGPGAGPLPGHQPIRRDDHRRRWRWE